MPIPSRLEVPLTRRPRPPVSVHLVNIRHCLLFPSDIRIVGPRGVVYPSGWVRERLLGMRVGLGQTGTEAHRGQVGCVEASKA